MVDYNIIAILRNRYYNCLYYHYDDNISTLQEEKCAKEFNVFDAAETNYFIKCKSMAFMFDNLKTN